MSSCQRTRRNPTLQASHPSIQFTTAPLPQQQPRSQQPHPHTHRASTASTPSQPHRATLLRRIRRTSRTLPITSAQPKRQVLVPKGNILLDGVVVAVSVGDVEVRQVVGRDEEHVLLLVEVLEAGGVVGEFEGGVGGGGVAEEDCCWGCLVSCIPCGTLGVEGEGILMGGEKARLTALDLVGKVGHHLWIVAHDVRVGGVGHEDELAARVCFEDFLEEELADAQGCAYVAEVERTGVEASARVGRVYELCGLCQ